MLSHILLSFYRSAQKQHFYTALNLMGLGVGIAVFITLMLVVNYERGFNHEIPQADFIQRLDTTWTLPDLAPDELAFSSLGALDQLRSDFPQIDAGTRMLNQRVVVTTGRTAERQLLSYVDPNFLDVIRLPLRAGTRSQALNSTSAAVITESTALKYFGTVDAIGKTLVVGQGGSKLLYTVSAVLRDLPPNVTLDVSMLLPLTPAVEAHLHFSRRLDDLSGETWLRFRNQADADVVAAGLRSLCRPAYGKQQLRSKRYQAVGHLPIVPRTVVRPTFSRHYRHRRSARH